MGSNKPEVITKQRSGIRTEVVWNQNRSGMEPGERWFGTRTNMLEPGQKRKKWLEARMEVVRNGAALSYTWLR